MRSVNKICLSVLMLGAAAIELLQKPELVAKARAEFEACIRETPYVCPIPAGVKPPLNG